MSTLGMRSLIKAGVFFCLVAAGTLVYLAEEAGNSHHQGSSSLITADPRHASSWDTLERDRGRKGQEIFSWKHFEAQQSTLASRANDLAASLGGVRTVVLSSHGKEQRERGMENGGLSVSDANSIPTLRIGASSRRGKALRQKLQLLINRLKEAKLSRGGSSLKQHPSKNRQIGGPAAASAAKKHLHADVESDYDMMQRWSQRARSRTAGAGGEVEEDVRVPEEEGRPQHYEGKVYSDPYDNPYHAEPYDQAMEQKKWVALAEKFRHEHPHLSPKSEQKALDDLWRHQYTYHYHAFGPKKRRAKAAGSPTSESDKESTPAAPKKKVPPLVYPPAGPRVACSTGEGCWDHEFPQPTVLAPPQGPSDFNGATAVIAHLPRLGSGPTQLDEYQKEVRGSFQVRVFGATGQPVLEVSRTWGCNPNPQEGFRCTYRAYRHLSADFTGNTVVTGFKRVWYAKRILTTGMAVSPTGDPKVFDVMTCRDLDSGEVQFFKLHPEIILSRMRERYCQGDIPDGSIGACAW